MLLCDCVPAHPHQRLSAHVDLTEVLRLEPGNKEAARLIQAVAAAAATAVEAGASEGGAGQAQGSDAAGL